MREYITGVLLTRDTVVLIWIAHIVSELLVLLEYYLNAFEELHRGLVSSREVKLAPGVLLGCVRGASCATVPGGATTV